MKTSLVGTILFAALAALEPAAPAAAPASSKIIYQDSGGFTGQGTGKWLALSGDGQLEVKRRNGSAMTVQLQDQELADVHKAVAAVDWKAVARQYRSQGADLMINDLIVTIGGKDYQTHADQLARLPPGLRALFKRLDALHRRTTAAKKPPGGPEAAGAEQSLAFGSGLG